MITACSSELAPHEFRMTYEDITGYPGPIFVLEPDDTFRGRLVGNPFACEGTLADSGVEALAIALNGARILERDGEVIGSDAYELEARIEVETIDGARSAVTHRCCADQSLTRVTDIVETALGRANDLRQCEVCPTDAEGICLRTPAEPSRLCMDGTVYSCGAAIVGTTLDCRHERDASAYRPLECDAELGWTTPIRWELTDVIATRSESAPGSGWNRFTLAGSLVVANSSGVTIELPELAHHLEIVIDGAPAVGPTFTDPLFVMSGTHAHDVSVTWGIEPSGPLATGDRLTLLLRERPVEEAEWSAAQEIPIGELRE
jgi:hypothetical protein